MGAVLVATPGTTTTTGGVAAPEQTRTDDAEPPAAEQPGDGPTNEGPGAPEGPLALNSENLGGAVSDINEVRDFGPLGDEARLDTCVEAAGIDPDRQPIGFRPVTIDGQDAVMVLYTTGELAQYRMVALSPDCGPANPEPVRDEIIGR